MLVPDLGGPTWPPAAGAAAFLQQMQMQGGFLQGVSQLGSQAPANAGGGYPGGGGYQGSFQTGGGQGSSEWKRPMKWPRKEDIPVDPLDPEREIGIHKLLQDAGGVLPLGKVTEKFPGLKRMQLKGIFELNKVGNDGQFEVRLPGCQSTGAEIMFQGQALSKDAPLPDLDAESIALIKHALQQEPAFTMSMAKIKEVVPGVNKAQIMRLDQDFDVIRLDKKHYNIALKQDGSAGSAKLGDQWRQLFHQRFGSVQDDPTAKRLRTE